MQHALLWQAQQIWAVGSMQVFTALQASIVINAVVYLCT